MQNVEPILTPTIRATVGTSNSKYVYTGLHVRKMLYNLVRRVKSQEKAGNLIGVSKVFISMVMRGKRAPGPKILNYFGLEEHTVYTMRVGRHDSAVEELNQELREKYGNQEAAPDRGAVDSGTDGTRTKEDESTSSSQPEEAN